MVWPLVLAMNSTVTGLGTVAVSTPAPIVALVIVNVSSRLIANGDRAPHPKMARMLRHSGSRIAVRAVDDGTRNANTMLTSVTPSVMRVGEVPIRERIK